MSRATFRERLRYWFDNTMSRGTVALIGWLALVSLGLILMVTLLSLWLTPCRGGEEPRRHGHDVDGPDARR